MHVSLLAVSKVVKQEENNYVFFGEKINIRVCNQNCEYITIFQENKCGEKNYKLGLSNLGNSENFESTNNRSIFGEKFKFYPNLCSNSEFYLFNLNQLLINYCGEKKHVQYGDKVYISSLINNEVFIIGFDQNSGKFLVSKFEEVAKYLRIKGQLSDDSFLKKYEWSLEKIPITKEESLLGEIENSPIPNIQSVKYNDLFRIRFDSEQIVCTQTIKSNLKMQFNQLSIDSTCLSGRNGCWTIIPLKFEGTVYPNWFLMKKILKSKDNNSLKFLDSRIIEKLAYRAGCSKSKIEPIRIDTFNLVSDRPIDWDMPSTNLFKDESLNAKNKFSAKSLNLLPSIVGFVFDHAETGINNTTKQNIIPNKLSSFSIKVQEQLILEDILNCLMCNNANYIKVTEEVVEFFHECKHLDFTSEDLYIFEFNSTPNNDKHFDHDYFSGREGIPLFSHQIIDDPSNLQYFCDDLIYNTISEEKNTENNLSGSFESNNILSTNNFKKNPSLYPLSYRTLELSSLHRRIRKFLKVHESGNSQFGIVSGTLCDSFRELLKHFTIKIAKFESYLRKGQLTIQNIWSHSQQALITLKALDLISTRVLYKRGSEIIDQVYKIANNEFKGEESSQKIANFVFNQIFFSWYKHFLAPWLKFGAVTDHFSEFINCQLNNLTKKRFMKNNLYSLTSCREQGNKLFPILPSFLKDLIEQVNYIGLVSYFVSHINHFYTENQLFDKGHENGVSNRKKLENVLGLMLKSLSNRSDSIRGEEIGIYINDIFLESQTLLFRVCNSIIDVRSIINAFYEIFFCANDSLIQEFIEYIHRLGSRGNKINYYSCNDITRKWDELMLKCYKELHNSNNSNRFSCIIEKKLITECVNEELFTPVKWEISSYILCEELKSIEKNKSSISSFDAFKFLTIKFCEVKAFDSIWPRKLLNKYELIFKLIFHLKYINHLLNNIWIAHQTSNIWDNKLTKTEHLSVNELILRPYFLRQKMLFLTTGILEYIYQDVINPLWNSMIKDFKNISTLEELNSRQDQLLNEILAQCFCLESEQLHLLYKILSLCHLFAAHSNLLNIYGFSNQTITDAFHSEKTGKKYEESGQISISSTKPYKKDNFGRTRGRTRINNMHIEGLLADPTYENIVEKFSSKFELLMRNFFSKISNCKNQKINMISKLVLKLNYNGYYVEKIPINIGTWGDPTLDEDDSYDNFVIESE
ncbi:gamma-tubulin complex associated protein [Cryptosporidium ubiquitum]|uniref:Gamma-tubulin complex associated protein n=1 Tax=Cryptosporidium ubiquitum TaxID=857276 RepID=A0A1J4MKY3_9CRYT|nr:gamma-tubulin complex associated protein [Cryptosporidium ubiquitum]OII74846.1 gamma-tubulin complex associated protein [Cryptosporidium ubiquitum]